MDLVACVLLALAALVGGAQVEINREPTTHPTKVTTPDLKVDISMGS
jgi:hypothetical protein